MISSSKQNSTRQTKEPIFEYIPFSINQQQLFNSTMFEDMSTGSKRSYHKKHMHNKSFEPVTQSSLSGYNPSEFHRKVQHFKHGQTSGGSPSNQLIYGTVDMVNLDMSTIKPKQRNISKYYSTDTMETTSSIDIFGNFQTNPQKQSNVFSLEERTSAEIRKKQREVEEREKDYARYLQEKEMRNNKMKTEKRREFELQKSYKAPWGRAGGGAPNETHERTKKIHKLCEDDDHILPFGRPGCGAPLKTNSGNLKAGLVADPEIRFQKKDRDQIYNVIEPERRIGNSNPFQTELDILSHETRTKRNVMKRNQDMSANVYDPFGRPGAGAPIVDENGMLKTNRSLNLAKTVSEQDVSQPNMMVDTAHPYGTSRLKKTIENNFEGFNFGRSGAGAPLVDENGCVMTSKKQTLVRSNDGAVVKSETSESFSDRGGGGAPLRDHNGNVVTSVGGKLQADNMSVTRDKQDAVAKKAYLETLRQQAEEHKQAKGKAKIEIHQTSDDTIAWLSQGKVGKPPLDNVTNRIIGAPRATSDIVKQRFEMNENDRDKVREYHQELDKQSKLVEQNRVQHTKQQREKSVEHIRTMEATWGKPGCGAPTETRRRQKADDCNGSLQFTDLNHQQSELITSNGNELTTHKTLSYITKKEQSNGDKVFEHVMSHEVLDYRNERPHHAPFATDFDDPSEKLFSSDIRPVKMDTPIHSNADIPPPPKNVMLSKGLRKKLTLWQHKALENGRSH